MYKKIKILMPLLLIIPLAVTLYLGAFTALDNVVYDNLLLDDRPVSPEIIIVGMDERSMNNIGAWPWTRDYFAAAIEKLDNAGAAAIGANVLFDLPSAVAENDEALVLAASQTDRLVLGGMGYSESYADETTVEDYILPFDELAMNAHVGFLNIAADRDGTLRRALTEMHYGDIKINSFAREVYRTYCKSMGIAENPIPLDDEGKFFINYAARPGQYAAVSFWDLINDNLDPAMFKNKIVLIGIYAQGLETQYSSPFDKSGYGYSIELNANIIQNMQEGVFKTPADLYIELIVMVALALILMFLLHQMKPLMATAFICALVALQLSMSRVVFDRLDLIIGSADVVIWLILCYGANLVLSILTAQGEKQYIQGVFGRFVAPEVVKELVSGQTEIKLGGAEREISVLFVDIRGFTAFSEANPPERVVEMVNRYLELTSKSIQDNGGTIDKYIGDATMAVFNAPNDLTDHALCAVRAAWAMKEGSESLRDEILKEFEVDLQFGIGIHTGLAVVGNMGSDFRMDYTAIGDTVNTAARLEANSQKGQIIISDATYQLVNEHIGATDLGVIKVKNKQTGIQIYNVDGVKNP